VVKTSEIGEDRCIKYCKCVVRKEKKSRTVEHFISPVHNAPLCRLAGDAVHGCTRLPTFGRLGHARGVPGDSV
jgi:hypothetical protein